MRNPEEVIVRPMITEKSTQMQEQGNQVVFRVVKNANKVEIRNAVEQLFGVKVVAVRTQRTPSRRRRVGRSVGMRPSWKKAIVRLREGDRIEGLSGV
jgi:large subunit ribosomal protein L23